MQEGAGVRQVIDDELRGAGTRLRDLDVRLELGLQESVKSAVEAGHGVTFISRTAVERELETGTLAEARVRGLEPSREISLVRAAGRVSTRVADAFVEFARRTAVIVRWGLGELEGLLAELGAARPFLVASPRWDPPVDVSGEWREVPSDRIADAVASAADVRQRARGRRRQRDRPREGDLGRDRASARLGADDVLGRRVDADLRGPRSRPADERRRLRREARRDRLRPGAHARPPAAGDGRNLDERARPLLPRRSTSRGATRTAIVRRSQARA